MSGKIPTISLPAVWPRIEVLFWMYGNVYADSGGPAITCTGSGPQKCVAEIVKPYKQRRDVFVSKLWIAIGWPVENQKQSMFLLVRKSPEPNSVEMGSLESFSKKLLKDANSRGYHRVLVWWIRWWIYGSFSTESWENQAPDTRQANPSVSVTMMKKV